MAACSILEAFPLVPPNLTANDMELERNAGVAISVPIASIEVARRSGVSVLLQILSGSPHLNESVSNVLGHGFERFQSLGPQRFLTKERTLEESEKRKDDENSLLSNIPPIFARIARFLPFEHHGNEA
jgi:hypothetical protein